jgi:hypothetical protein
MSHERRQMLMTDLATIKAQHQQLWTVDDFAMIATTQTIMSERLCEAVDLRAGQMV